VDIQSHGEQRSDVMANTISDLVPDRIEEAVGTVSPIMAE
jgi:hypothetical protein